MQSLPNALTPLGHYRQWMCYQLVNSRKKPGKFDKFPVSTNTAQIVDAHNPQHWTDYQTAIDTAASWGDGYGVAFVFTDDDPFFFVDIDGAYDGVEWSTLSTQLCAMFPGAAIEVSQSGSGLHIIGQYSGDAPEHGCKNTALNLELYTSGRFVALTGTGIQGSAQVLCDQPLTTLIEGYFPLSASDRIGDVEWTSGPLPGHRPISDDEKLIDAMCASESSANRFGKASAKDLWECNVDALAHSYPDDVRDFDASSADAALAQHLSFWTCGDCERIESLMRESELARDKWDYHKKYLTITIKSAVARTENFYSKGADVQVPEPAKTNAPSLVMREGFQLMSADQQKEYFKGCVYVCDVHRMFTPTGTMLKVEQFNAMFGGYAFALDSDHEKTTKKAFEVFTESQCLTFPKADKSCFRPEIDSGAILVEEGIRLVNTYVPIDIHMSDGDVSLFLTHLEKLLPNERDRTILMSYMAACIQHKGYKIQWAPLIQGVEGNGKTLFTRVVAYAIGERYTHMPPAAEIGEKFNSWLFNSMFIGVEDIYVPEQKREVLEILKPMITNRRLAKRAMNTDQTMQDVCANFIFNSNYKDAVRKTQNDRRFCIFYTAQQEELHLHRDGLGGDYFPKIYHWLNNGGYAAVAGYLSRYEIAEEFNPTTQCQRAPETSSTREAVSMSLGSIEQEITEAIEEGRVGFQGGWVSAHWVDVLLKELRKDKQVPQNRRRQLLNSLGYDWHPGLKDGRANNPIAMDEGKKSRLYIRTGHIHSNLQGGSEIARYYAAAQGDPLARKSVDECVNS